VQLSLCQSVPNIRRLALMMLVISHLACARNAAKPSSKGTPRERTGAGNAGDAPATPDAGAPGMLYPVMTTRLILVNRSGGPISWVTTCGAPITIQAVDTEPELPREQEQQRETVLAEVGCPCFCEWLRPDQVCNANDCRISGCSLGASRVEVADGKDYEEEWSGGNTAADPVRKCLYPTGFRPGRAFVAKFCWSTELVAPVCKDAMFEYGAPSVTVVAEPASGEPRRSSDADAGR
jgi:hypothetical protein